MPRKTIKQLEQIIAEKDMEIHRLRYRLLGNMKIDALGTLTGEQFLRYIDELEMKLGELKRKEGK